MKKSEQDNKEIKKKKKKKKRIGIYITRCIASIILYHIGLNSSIICKI